MLNIEFEIQLKVEYNWLEMKLKFWKLQDMKIRWNSNLIRIIKKNKNYTKINAVLDFPTPSL